MTRMITDDMTSEPVVGGASVYERENMRILEARMVRERRHGFHVGCTATAEVIGFTNLGETAQQVPRIPCKIQRD